MITNKKQPVSLNTFWSWRILLLIVNYSFLIVNCTAEVRYVSKSGSSTPPYTSWETASDSIQKAINICNDGDTIYVGNGVYKENLIIDSAITLLGSSMDSTVIDGAGLNSVTIRVFNNIRLEGFNIIGKELNDDINTTAIVDGNFNINIDISNSKISNCYRAIGIARQSGTLENIIFDNVKIAVYTFCMSDTCKPKLYNSVIIIDRNGREAWMSYDGGQPTILNNIFVTDGWNTAGGSAAQGIDYAFRGHKKLVLKNNLFSGFSFNKLFNTPNDSAEIINNIFTEQGDINTAPRYLEGLRSSDKVRNNIIMRTKYAIWAESQPDMDYNIFWKNEEIINSPYQLGENDMIVDPMIVKDTVGYSFAADYHLQKFSPAIDNGDPEIIDVDGSRSDIGLFGGPLGEAYKYLDFPPASPTNFIAAYDSSMKKVILSWNMNTESDFMKYIIYRSDKPDFIPDSSNKFAESNIAFFTDSSVAGYEALFYRITAVDSQQNESISGQTISISITNIEDNIINIISDYTLYQNYPNPFNSRTRINYGLKEAGYVKLMIYTLTGELMLVIVNGDREAGFYEIDVDMNNFSSGIYLYRIEVIGRGGIPVFMDMKKMLMVK